jgi:hypothetical protein
MHLGVKTFLTPRRQDAKKRRRGPMRESRWLWVAVLVWLGSGCCAHPGLFEKVHASVATVQGFYDPLVQQYLGRNELVQQAVVAADTTLLLAAALQQQWCPSPDNTQQLELQAQEAKKLAQEAGVVEAGTYPGQVPRKGTE